MSFDIEKIKQDVEFYKAKIEALDSIISSIEKERERYLYIAKLRVETRLKLIDNELSLIDIKLKKPTWEFLLLPEAQKRWRNEVKDLMDPYREMTEHHMEYVRWAVEDEEINPKREELSVERKRLVSHLLDPILLTLERIEEMKAVYHGSESEEYIKRLVYPTRESWLDRPFRQLLEPEEFEKRKELGKKLEEIQLKYKDYYKALSSLEMELYRITQFDAQVYSENARITGDEAGILRSKIYLKEIEIAKAQLVDFEPYSKSVKPLYLIEKTLEKDLFVEVLHMNLDLTTFRNHGSLILDDILRYEEILVMKDNKLSKEGFLIGMSITFNERSRYEWQQIVDIKKKESEYHRTIRSLSELYLSIYRYFVQDITGGPTEGTLSALKERLRENLRVTEEAMQSTDTFLRQDLVKTETILKSIMVFYSKKKKEKKEKKETNRKQEEEDIYLEDEFVVLQQTNNKNKTSWRHSINIGLSAAE